MMLLEWVITSIFLVLTVLALRAAFGRRVSARLRYALWAVVLMRLLVPVQLFTSPLAGVWVLPESRTEQNVAEWPITSDTNFAAGPDDWPHLDLPDGLPVTYFPAVPHAPESPTAPIAPEIPAAPDLTKLPACLGWAWLCGSIVLALVLAASNLRFALRLRRCRIPLKWADCPLPVYAAVGLPSPCLFGLIRPAVYVTPEAAADPDRLRHVIAHEYTHFRQGDHLWSFLRCAALAVHWWNPLVWLAVKLSRRDGELACDEGALKRLGDGERLAYGNTLLALVTAKPGPGDLLCFATTMAGEKRSLKERISRIANAPKRWLWAAVAVVLATALACACAFGSAEEPGAADGPDAEPTDSAGEFTPVYTIATGDGSGDVLVEGLGDAHVEWSDGTSVALHLTGDLGFCCPSLAGRQVDGSAMWDDETRTGVSVVMSVYDDRAVSEAAVGFYIHFRVELGSGTVLESAYQSEVEGEMLELTDKEMVDMARAFAKLMTEAENYYRNHSALSDYNNAEGLIRTDSWVLRNTQALNAATDLNRNGVPETVVVGDVCDPDDKEGTREPYGRGVGVLEGGEVLWMGWGSYAHAGEVSFLLYSEGDDHYLMEFEIHGNQGKGSGDYRIFTLEGGVETMAWENHVMFDYCTNSLASVKDNFDPEAVAAFVDEVDGLLEHCFLLVDTGYNYRGDPPAYVQIDLRWLESYAPGFHWDDSLTTLENLTRFKLLAERPLYAKDLNGDMRQEMILVSELDGGAGLRVELRDESSGKLFWSEEGYYSHAGWNAVFLCTLDGKDYLLRYNPYGNQGLYGYSYQLFTLTRDGKEQVARENHVEFDVNFGSPVHQSFDPEAIAAFMDEINGLLAHSVQLINTDDGLLDAFRAAGRLYDGRWWLDPSVSMLESLRAYKADMEVGTTYQSVLLGKAQFMLIQDDAGYYVGIDDVPALICGEDDTYAKIWDFAVVDMDGDGREEVLARVFGVTFDNSGYLLLRRLENGTILGAIFNAHNNWSNRWFYDLKTDGTFECQGVLDSWHSISKLFFTDGFGTGIYGLTVIRGYPDFDLESFMTIQKEITREEDWWAAVEAQKEKPDAVWYEFNAENIAEVFMKG